MNDVLPQYSSLPFYSRLIQSLKEKFNQNSSQSYYILSTSLEKDNLTLWSEFSDAMGYCLGINLEKIRNSLTENSKFVFEGHVIYNLSEQLEILKNLLDELAQSFEFPEKEGVYNSFNTIPHDINEKTIDNIASIIAVSCHFHALFFKDSVFKSENEYRFVIVGMHGSKVDEKFRNQRLFRTKDGVIIPFSKVDNSDNSYLEEIVIGPKNNSDLAEKGIALFCEHLKIGVPVFKSKSPLRY